MRSGSRKAFDDLYLKAENMFRIRHVRTDAKKIYKTLGPDSEELIKSYKEEVLPFWSAYQQKPPLYWFRMFSKDGKTTDPRYIPDDIWLTTIMPYYCNSFFRRPYEDKCMHSVLFPTLNRPRTIVKNMAGQFYTDDFSPISREEALKRCQAEESFIIKPSIDSGAGRLIQFYDSKIDSPEKIPTLFEALKNNFIVQEIVKQHPVLEALHPGSLNTIRVLSFFFEEEVHILSVIVRMGTGDAKVDNVTAGGMQCGVYPDGRCYELACTKKRDWVDKAPGGAVFAETRLSAYEKIIDCVKREHLRFPHFRLIGWDFSVNADEEPVFIEYNVCPGPNQMTCGPTFGDLTEKVLEDVFIKKTLADAKN